ncbi:MAG: hypothetical protein WCW62_10335 [Bacteroidales bacterium]|jgi:hypothetical protein
MLEKELKYYIDHQDDLVAKYNGKFLVIKDQSVVDVCDSLEDAYFQSIKKYKPGTFLIQECSPGEESYTQTFHSRAIFT